jgi:hypothetical protein
MAVADVYEHPEGKDTYVYGGGAILVRTQLRKYASCI